MKKKWKIGTAALLAVSVAFGIAGCGGKTESSPLGTEETQEEVSETVESSVEEGESGAADENGTPGEEAGNTEKKETAQLPKIGIAWAGYGNEDTVLYIDAVEKAGAVAVMLPKADSEEEAEAALETVDAVILTGGEDIDPSYYGEEPDDKLEELNKDRDTSDFHILTAALEEDMPMLTICRGTQFLNIVCGGSLYQDFPSQRETEVEVVHRDPEKEIYIHHNIDVEEGKRITEILGSGTVEVNSWHHQCIKELGEGLTVTATAPDGIIEAVEKEDSSFVMGVQFHPEEMVASGYDEFLGFFEMLAEYAEKE